MVSNKTLALIIVAAVVISLGGTMIGINKLKLLKEQEGKPHEYTEKVTGLATSGVVNFSVTSTASCTINNGNVTLGSGTQPTASYSLTTDRDNSAGGFNNCVDNAALSCQGLQLNNTGNVNLNITMNSNANASTFLGSQTNLDITDFRYFIVNGSSTNNGSQGCRNITNGTTQIPLTPLNVIQSIDHMICTNLTYVDGNDVMHIEYNITIEPDIAPGTKSATITITCEQTSYPI